MTIIKLETERCRPKPFEYEATIITHFAVSACGSCLQHLEEFLRPWDFSKIIVKHLLISAVLHTSRR